MCVCVRERERVMQTDILAIQFPDAENKLDSRNVGLFAFQPPDGACNFFFLPPFHFILDVHN